MKKKLKLRKEAYFIFIIMIIVILSISGFIYAFFKLGSEQKECLNSQLSELVKLENMVPLDETKGRESEPFQITITNECDSPKNYSLNLETNNGSEINEEDLVVILDDSNLKILSTYPATSKTLNNSKSSHILSSGELKAHETRTFKIKIWLKEDAVINENNQYLGNFIVN